MVTVDNRASASFTVVDVRAEDQVGLLHAIASSLTLANVEISLAKVATEAHAAIDSFYVIREGSKITEPEEVKALIAAIEGAIATLDTR